MEIGISSKRGIVARDEPVYNSTRLLEEEKILMASVRVFYSLINFTIAKSLLGGRADCEVGRCRSVGARLPM